MSESYFKQLVYSGFGGQRFTQDSPVMPDVWVHFGLLASTRYTPGTKNLVPRKRMPLLLTPYQGHTPGELAQVVRKDLAESKSRPEVTNDPGARVAMNQSVVAADLVFEELLNVIVPMSSWWSQTVTPLFKDKDVRSKLIEALRQKHYFPSTKEDLHSDVVWLAKVVGTLALLYQYPRIRVGVDGLSIKKKDEYEEFSRKDLRSPDRLNQLIVDALFEILSETIRKHQKLAEAAGGSDGDDGAAGQQGESQGAGESLDEPLGDAESAEPSPDSPDIDVSNVLWSINRNRTTEASLVDSRPAVKADATQAVFDVSGKHITWAVIDSGIDACHIAFRKRKADGTPESATFEIETRRGRRPKWTNCSRVKETYDFVKLRELLSADKDSDISEELRARLTKQGENGKVTVETLLAMIKQRKVLDWEVLLPFIRVPHEGSDALNRTNQPNEYARPVNPHGTHVAGIIAADWHTTDKGYTGCDGAGETGKKDLVGVAPGVELIDIRVLRDDGTGDEFSMMAGLQFVRYLNNIHEQRQVHGVNLSFALRHDFTIFACGATPICQEAERLVDEGTVVVAAAGNDGTARYRMVDEKTGEERESNGYRSISITDPGNAEKVITVGATHRREPHTYGVSYFSSRGPTGDGRRKPDLVAPGEKITSTMPNHQVGPMDGTSQAAPHVSGAVALLMERNQEMIGNPLRIKQILCNTATDLGRESYFQGAGMLDILRALQSI